MQLLYHVVAQIVLKNYTLYQVPFLILLLIHPIVCDREGKMNCLMCITLGAKLFQKN